MQLKIIHSLIFIPLLSYSFSQESLSIFKPLMITADSVRVDKDITNNTVQYTYYNPEGTEVSFYRYTLDGEILLYQCYDFNLKNSYILESVAWEENRIISFHILGPNGYNESYALKPDGSEVHVHINSNGKGSLAEIDTLGIVVRSEIIINNERICRTYFPISGHLKSMYTCDGLGNRYGKYQEYNELGNIIVSGQYIAYSDINIVDCNKECKTGYWYYFNDKGRLLRTEYYESGELTKAVKGKMKI